MSPFPTGWHWMLPELWLGGFLLLFLGWELRFGTQRPETMGGIAAFGLLTAIPALVWQSLQGPTEVLGGMYRIDPLATFFKWIFLATALLVVLMTREGANRLGGPSAQAGRTPLGGRSLEESLAAAAAPASHGEFYLLLFTATLGMFFTAASANFLMLFVSLELIAISFYILTSYLKHRDSLEAGLKYLVLGSLASGLLLYGIALLYGFTGSLQLFTLRTLLQSLPTLSPPLLLGLMLALTGLFFKIAVVPFHLWVPDVYEGAPTPVTAFLSVGSKAAGFLVTLRLLHELFLPHTAQWSLLAAWIAALTILYGNLGAIPQRRMKRLLGYSSVGHAGYLLIGIAAGSHLGAAAVNFYLASYLVTNLAIFLVIAQFSRHVDSDEIRAYAGLSRRSPFLAAVMFLGLLSLAGVPPLSGFFGKFLLLLSAVWEGYLPLALVGAAAVVISLYYYLLIVKTLYADPAIEATPIPVTLSVRVALWLCLAGIVGMGIWQGPWLAFASAAARHWPL